MTLVNGTVFPTVNYLIDTTEVTREQYEGWLLTNPSIAAQPTSCKPWNTTFVPDATCMAGWTVCKGASCGQHPQVCVDWCDAKAYCQSVGKRLCGRIGGGVLQPSETNDATKAQWYNACSAGGSLAFPYGNSYGAHKCNGYEHGIGTTVSAGSMSTCQSSKGGYVNVFDMSGNVYEWEDVCNGSTGQYNTCSMRGGAYKNAAEDSLRCLHTNQANARSYYFEDLGFRCCKDL
jgi:formylglycine-generating enzyme required for sulfatase activity